MFCHIWNLPATVYSTLYSQGLLNVLIGQPLSAISGLCSFFQSTFAGFNYLYGSTFMIQYSSDDVQCGQVLRDFCYLVILSFLNFLHLMWCVILIIIKHYVSPIIRFTVPSPRVRDCKSDTSRVGVIERIYVSITFSLLRHTFFLHCKGSRSPSF